MFEFEDSDAADEAYGEGHDNADNGISIEMVESNLSDDTMPFDEGLGIALGFSEEMAQDGVQAGAQRRHREMTEEEALAIFDAAEAVGIGAEISLEESAEIRYQRAKEESLLIAGDLVEDEEIGVHGYPKALKDRKLREEDSRYSSLTGKLKCPFNQWMKDVCAGRKTIYDPVGGEDSHGKSKY